MEIGYEKPFDDLVIMFKDNYKYKDTIELSKDFLVDIDKGNKIVAIEVVNCSKQLGVSPKYIEEADIDSYIEPYPSYYNVVVSFNNGEKKIERKLEINGDSYE